MKQRTLAREVSISGSALHTGEAVTLTLKPPGGPRHCLPADRPERVAEIKPRIDLVTDLVRATTIQEGHAKIHHGRARAERAAWLRRRQRGGRE